MNVSTKFNSKFYSFVNFLTKFNSKFYSFVIFLTKFNSKIYSFVFFLTKFNSKIYSFVIFFDKIQLKNLFKMLKLAVFNSLKYSFNKKSRVSNRARGGVCFLRTFPNNPISCFSECSPKWRGWKSPGKG